MDIFRLPLDGTPGKLFAITLEEGERPYEPHMFTIGQDENYVFASPVFRDSGHGRIVLYNMDDKSSEEVRLTFSRSSCRGCLVMMVMP